MTTQTEAMKMALEALERLDGWIALRHGLGLTPQEKEVVTALRQALTEQPAQPSQPLTDEQCDAIYTALDEWSREVDEYEFGLPAVAGGGIEKGREIIKTAHGITKGNT